MLPPPGENRFAPDLILAIIRDDVSEQQINALLTANGLARTNNGGERVALINARLYRFRITDRRPVATVLAALGRDPRVLTTQPDYRFTLGQSATAAPSVGGAAAASFGALQYSARKLQLEQAHQVGRGDQVRVAIIDSLIDAAHPELTGGIGKQIDVLDGKDATAHAHGTAMAGAIIARSRLTGVAPAAKVIGIRAFSVSASGATSGSTFDLVRALDRAVGEGAQVINLSFAGPKDPLLQRAIGAAAGKGSVMIAAAGNAGPKSPPLFPAADPNVIAVTATDSDDKVFAGANRGAHIAIAAPGGDIIVPGPGVS